MFDKQSVMNELRLLYHHYFEQTKITLLRQDKNIILAGIPIHNNLGDQAIALAEERFLEDNFPDSNVVEIQESQVQNSLHSLKKQVRDGDVICYQGGGNIGNLYPVIEKQRRSLIKNLSGIPIVTFPESIFFEDKAVRFLSKSQRIYNQHVDLTIITRETFSEHEAKRLFYRTHHGLTPDIVFYLIKSFHPQFSLDQGLTNVLTVLRDDQEVDRSLEFSAQLEYFLTQNFEHIFHTDTMSIKMKIRTNEERIQAVQNKLSEFKQSSLIITDRLHGMLFAILAGRPVIVLKNSNFKISATVETWLMDCPFVFLITENQLAKLEESLEAVKEINVNKARQWYQKLDFMKLYAPLIAAINQGQKGIEAKNKDE